jgi:hypothetical protein
MMNVETADVYLSEYDLTDEEGHKYVNGTMSYIIEDGDAVLLLVEDDNGAIVWEDDCDNTEQGMPEDLWWEINNNLEEAEETPSESLWQQNGFESASDFWAWKEG